MFRELVFLALVGFIMADGHKKFDADKVNKDNIEKRTEPGCKNFTMYAAVHQCMKDNCEGKEFSEACKQRYHKEKHHNDKQGGVKKMQKRDENTDENKSSKCDACYKATYAENAEGEKCFFDCMGKVSGVLPTGGSYNLDAHIQSIDDLFVDKQSKNLAELKRVMKEDCSKAIASAATEQDKLVGMSYCINAPLSRACRFCHEHEHHGRKDEKKSEMKNKMNKN